MKLKTIEFKSPQRTRCNTGQSRGLKGKPSVQTVVQIERTKNPAQKKQWIKAIAIIKRATFTQKAVIETEIYFLPFMEAVMKFQEKWPNAERSYQALAVTAALKEPPPTKVD